MAHTLMEHGPCPACGDLEGCHIWHKAAKADKFTDNIREEVWRAMKLHAPFHSDHEAYSVILEELDEYWDEVKKKRSRRDRDAMRTELVQIAAMAVRALADLDY